MKATTQILSEDWINGVRAYFARIGPEATVEAMETLRMLKDDSCPHTSRVFDAMMREAKLIQEDIKEKGPQ